ncbi:cellulose biosynthesis cyclic di-GMP-binding regulatory protein BcsB [Erwinia pyrifoliae]|uniref:Cyclic di-GMP-binding protein n=1 Tax=Erwinia pyrifoliae TaxID=79967 RepID=A0ABY5X840_ERWPY|nr:cellulose biosynthesis cyclic di-GMP-binding regulatory protein BcsB [Erwinia pyrifoliae]AUX71116.1 cellulose biosynthesis cyclic di-GMP-binding regulatory protein BcsB [Erwinia pyrifoliae]MCA8875173.1 cellulose biosynthesis cyclic di-GMP-binding regulatory protein BcsB [Erwinia pyrifoliae]MCU8588918.1 cellulose biosynthesis cyclic di-GMP-binding regulatory protein BcsB [Erwinia pyrifoliae]UWS29266.1 cellulose biosynthesis cyclic di-GMP-binding regulatory protein BcsB [Erwinia pyrifoliae]UW
MKQSIARTLWLWLALTLGSAQAEPTSAIGDSAALADIPPPADVTSSAPAPTASPASNDPQQDRAYDAAAGNKQGLPPLPAVADDLPATPMAVLNQPTSSTISVAGMGQKQGITLNGGQLQSGIIFTLPNDEVVTHAQLNLSLKVSQALAARNASLQLMLNGQPLGTLPLSATESNSQDYALEIPAAMVVSRNNLSFKLNDADRLMCERDSARLYQVTILAQSTLALEGQRLNIGNSLLHFPRPFIDPLRMSQASVTMAFGQNVTSGGVSAAAVLASWMGIQADYRGVSFPVTRGRLPEQNGVVFGQPGEKIGSLTLPAAAGPLLQIIDNPDNPVYKLLLVIGKDDEALRQAAWRLLQPLELDAPQLAVANQDIPLRQPYDAPRWINTNRPVRLSELLRKDQSLTTTGIWHDALRVNFRAPPDLFLWDGDSIPVQLNYRFPSESWIDEDNSLLNVTLNGTFLRNLTVNKVGLLENIWHRLGSDARLEQYTLRLDPYLIYGDNQMQLYFNIKPKANAPCSVLANNNIKSRIEDNSFIDLSHTRHFTLLPNLSYFVGASFPFSRLADYSQTVLMLPEKPSDGEISTLLDMAGRSGNATGVALLHNRVMFGIPSGGALRERLVNSDILAVSTLDQSEFNRQMLADSPYTLNDHTLGVKVPGMLNKLRGWLNGDWYRQTLNADRYLSSNEEWRGFISYRSPWSSSRLVVMAVATDDQQLSRLHNDMTSMRINAGIRGDTAIITDENGIRSFRVGAQFPSGEIPWYMMVVWYANQHAVLLSLLALFCSAIVGVSAWVLLERHAWRRLHPQGKSRPSDENQEK